jgi:hypothetical protein
MSRKGRQAFNELFGAPGVPKELKAPVVAGLGGLGRASMRHTSAVSS